MTEEELKQSPSKEEEHEFNNAMKLVFDKDELAFRQKLQLYGNMKLLAELYCNNSINENIILDCFNSLLEEIND